MSKQDDTCPHCGARVTAIFERPTVLGDGVVRVTCRECGAAFPECRDYREAIGKMKMEVKDGV